MTFSTAMVGQRRLGKTAVLEQVYNRLFWEQDEVVPIYFTFEAQPTTSTEFAWAYFTNFLQQYVAFRLKDDALARLDNAESVSTAGNFGEQAFTPTPTATATPTATSTPTTTPTPTATPTPTPPLAGPAPAPVSTLTPQILSASLGSASRRSAQVGNSAGASGYLLKSMQAADFFLLITGLTEGIPPLAPQLAAKVLAEFQSRLQIEASLTDEQKRILGLVAQGRTYLQIGLELNLSERTVKRYMKEIMALLHVSSRAEVEAYAREQGRKNLGITLKIQS
jgi:DNA-binding CsgD family transcriptional regulator